MEWRCPVIKSLATLLFAILSAITALVPTAAHADCSSLAAKTLQARDLTTIISYGVAADREKDGRLRRAWTEQIRAHIDATAAFFKASCPVEVREVPGGLEFQSRYRATITWADRQDTARRLLELLATVFGNEDGKLDDSELDRLMRHTGARVLIQAAGWR